MQALQVQQETQGGGVANFTSLINSAVGKFCVYLVILICCLPYFISFAAFKMNGRNVKWWSKSPGKREHIVVDTLDVSWAAQTGKHLLRTQNVSEQNHKHFLCPGHKICVRNKCCASRQTGKHLCRQQCVRNNVSSFVRALTL